MARSTTALRRQLRSATELHAVVRAMKSLAASSVGQYERSVQALADYCRSVELGLGLVFRERSVATAGSAARGDVVPVALDAVVFGSDQGLVGEFNDVIARFAVAALAALPAGARVWAVGARVDERLADAGLPRAGCFSVPTSVDAIAPFVGGLLEALDAVHPRGELGELHLFHNRPRRATAYAPVGERLFSLDESWRRELAARPWPGRGLPEVLGDGEETLRALLGEHVFISLFRACAESLASENASRLAAMHRAERNIGELLERLEADYHRLRQGAIDEELFDVVAGFEALTGAGRR